MLSNKVINHLNENADLVLPEFQLKYRNRLEELGFNDKINRSFIEFITKYNDEHYGSEGCFGDFMQEVRDLDNSQTMILRKHDKLSDKFFSLFCGESDDYLFYNREDDSVKLIEAQNMKELSNDDYYDKKWNSFNEFLEDFFELN